MGTPFIKRRCLQHGHYQGERGWGRGEVEEGTDGRRPDLGWWVHNTIHRWCIIEWHPWNLYNFFNQYCPKKFNFNKVFSVSSLFGSGQACDCFCWHGMATVMPGWFPAALRWPGSIHTSFLRCQPPITKWDYSETSCYEKSKPHAEALEEETYVERQREQGTLRHRTCEGGSHHRSESSSFSCPHWCLVGRRFLDKLFPNSWSQIIGKIKWLFQTTKFQGSLLCNSR